MKKEKRAGSLPDYLAAELRRSLKESQKLQPIRRNIPRLAERRNQACPCGSTKIVEMYDRKAKKYLPPAEVPKKFKECCMKKEWTVYEPNWPNNEGSYNLEFQQYRERIYGQKVSKNKRTREVLSEQPS